MKQKQGTLIFIKEENRYDVRFDVSDYYGGLHCGECFEVYISGKWRPTCIERNKGWYLVGVREADLTGLRVRINA